MVTDLEQFFTGSRKLAMPWSEAVIYDYYTLSSDRMILHPVVDEAAESVLREIFGSASDRNA